MVGLQPHHVNATNTRASPAAPAMDRMWVACTSLYHLATGKGYWHPFLLLEMRIWHSIYFFPSLCKTFGRGMKLEELLQERHTPRTTDLHGVSDGEDPAGGSRDYHHAGI